MAPGCGGNIHDEKIVMELDEVETRRLELQESRRRVENKRKTESDEDREDDEVMSESPCDSVHSMHETPSKATKWENGCDALSLIKEAVVVLTRLPEYKISALRPPTPPQFYSEDESLSSSDSDMPWESEEDSSDSDFSILNKSSKSTTRTPAVPTTSNNSNEDGRLKYKVSFEEKGKCLVSGHHIAFDTRPKVEQLYVGARVVVRCQNNKFRFRPGILAELPSRKNQFRFLVFMDDHTPVYVGLPLFHLVCRPLDDVLDDLPDGPHKCFMKQYLKDWPYPRLNKYRPGQSFNVELNGAQQRCEVLVVDCSLIQIVFQENQRREWIFRGSMRLEHIARFLELKEREEAKDDSESVAACEENVRELYSLLGWEYSDSDSEEESTGGVTPGSNHADTAKTVQRLTPGEISINMSVLAKYGKLDWKRGTIKEIITKDDGRLKYKVVFEERGKCLVSGHHIAFTCMPKVGQLFVGARVVIQKPPGNPVFTPGVIAELPSRSNRMRIITINRLKE
ncbi:unnamed protein product [Menidia menidia]|uniref:(Atlantic silverside) hypothetical protein n=1 Tax=Menidia menidia TaxID=238744 RepID=A0A8S4AR75_9TELE|nr:unnamed protein product [Menidia menidia]